MIYLKKNEEEQELFIPKNGNYEGKKTFKDGVEYQKSLLSPIKFLKNGEYENPNGWNKVTVDVPLGEHTITKNGIYDARNGYLVRGGNNIGTVFMLKGGGYLWNVNPANTLKIELLFKPANEYGEFFDNTIRGIFGYDFEIGKFYVAEDAQNPNLIYASVGGWESERVQLTPEWHIISLSNSEFRIDGVLIANIPEGEYAPLNTQILLNGINNANGNSNYYYPNVGFYANFKVWADGVGVVDASPYFEDNSTFGYLNLYGGRLNTEIWRITNNWIALDEVNEPSFIEVQGFNYLTVNVPTGGECPELQELNVTENGTYEGAYNKVNVVVPDTNGSYDEGYNNGYNDGLNNRECPECPEYTQIEITENGIYDGYFDRVNVLVPQEGGDCDYQDYRELVLRAKVENAGFVDENTFWDKSKIVKFNEYTTDTADTIMLIDSDFEGWRGDYVTIVAKLHSGKFMLKEGLFSNLEDIYELEITCDTIDENAFNGCANLTKLVLPYAPNINENAFKGCTNLKEIEINYIKYIAPSAFDDCPTTGVIKVKNNSFDTSILPSSLSNWKIVYVEDNEVTDIIDVAKYGIKFAYSQFDKVPDFYDFSNVTNMEQMFSNCSSLTTIPQLNTSKVTNMANTFQGCIKLTTIPQLDTSKVTNMSYLFNSCKSLIRIPELDMTNVVNATYFASYCSKLEEVPNLNTINVQSFEGFLADSFPKKIGTIQMQSATSLRRFFDTILGKYDSLTDMGGFIGLKISWNDGDGLARCKNLSYQSCINILNGLYDFTGNGETPTSSQGQLKVHPNFLTTVGDEISIATNKGWQISA